MGSHSLSKRVGARRRRGRANGRNSNWQVEPLEPRTLLAFGPIGPQFPIAASSGPAIASDADGDFIVAGQGGGSVAVWQYAADGHLLREVFRGVGENPVVAADADGDFVVAWHVATNVQNVFTDEVYAKRFDSSGQALGGQFLVSSVTGSSFPLMAAMDADGDFVIGWTLGTVSGGFGLARYGATGALEGSLPATSSLHPPTGPGAIAMDAHGNTVLAWSASDGSGDGIFAKRFDAARQQVGPEIAVNSAILASQSRPSVATDRNGNFVVAWVVTVFHGIFARQFNSTGAAQGDEIQVNATFNGFESAPSVAVDADGDFAVTWQDLAGAYFRRFRAAGVAEGDVMSLSTSGMPSTFARQDVATDAEGDIVAVWAQPVGGLYGQRFDETTDTSGPMVGVEIADRPVLPTAQVSTVADEIVVNASELLSTAGGTSGAASATNPANWRLTRDGADVSSSIRSITFGRDPSSRKYRARLALASPLALAGNYVLTARESLRDPAGNALDGDRDGHPGGDFVLPFTVVNSAPVTLGVEAVQVVADENPTVINLFDVFSDANQPSSALSYSVVGNTNPSLFGSTSIDGGTGQLTLSYAPGATGESTLTVRAADSGGLTVQTSFTVTVTHRNQPPVNHVPGLQIAAPGQTLVFARSNGISISDPDAGSAPVVLTLETERGYGLQLSQTTGLINLSETNPIQYSGSIADLNAALDGLRLVPPAGAGEANTFIRITTNDQGNTGAGGPQSDVDTIPVTFSSNAIVLSVDDATVTEGDSGMKEATFTVRLSGRPADRVSVEYATADGTATAGGGDYEATNGVLEFDGQTQLPVTVVIFGDTAVEADEQFFLNLSNASGALIGDGHAVGTITNDDSSATPAFSISDAAPVTEGNAATTSATFTVTLAAPSSNTLSVDYATNDGTATSFVGGANQLADGGFEPPGVTQAVYSAGQKLGAWTVDSGAVFPAQGYQTLDGSTQVLDLHAGAPGGIYQDVATVAGQPYMLRFALAGNPSTPNPKQLQVSFDGVPIATESFDTTGRSFSDMGWVSKGYVVVPTSNVSRLRFASLTTGAAGPIIDAVTLVGMGDYDRRSGTLTFAPGVTSQTITVPIEGDTMDERDENFYVNLSNPQGGPVPITRGSGTAVILDDDAPPTVSVSDASATEGNSGTTQMVFTLTLSAPSGKATAISIGATNGTAQAGVDFGGPGGSIVFAPGETSHKVNVSVFGDTTPEPDESFYFVLSSPFELAIGDGTGVGTIVNDDGALEGPRVAQVYVAGSAWSPAYKQVLQANGQGDATFGYAVPAAAQLAVLPWGNLNQFSIRFDRDVLVGADDLTLAGVKTLAKKISSFRYDRATHTATWTLTQPLRDAALTLELDGDPGGVMDAAKKAPLDGEWTVGAKKYPSGNGTAGGDFRFALNVLAGDVDGNGSVNIRDTLRQRRRPASSVEKPGTGPLAYDPMADLNGDGAINAADMDLIRSNLMRSLPATGSSATAALRQSWSVLGTTHTDPS